MFFFIKYFQTLSRFSFLVNNFNPGVVKINLRLCRYFGNELLSGCNRSSCPNFKLCTLRISVTFNWTSFVRAMIVYFLQKHLSSICLLFNPRINYYVEIYCLFGIKVMLVLNILFSFFCETLQTFVCTFCILCRSNAVASLEKFVLRRFGLINRLWLMLRRKGLKCLICKDEREK